MDPWLERRWGDVHLGLCGCIRAALQLSLPFGLQAVGQEGVRLEEFNEEGKLQIARFYPDAAILEISGFYGEPLSEAESGSVAVAEPVTIRRVAESPIDRWVEIIDTADHGRIVTAIEVLSPGNKAAGKLNERYVQKINDYVNAGVNVVEIDLLRGTRDRMYIPTADLPPEKQADYYTVINRATKPDDWKVYPMRLREPLPTVPIPLRRTDKEVPLSLQPLIDRVYVEGGHYYTNYTAELPRPLPPADAAWAAGLISNSNR
jgi:hypothetical protein